MEIVTQLAVSDLLAQDPGVGVVADCGVDIGRVLDCSEMRLYLAYRALEAIYELAARRDLRFAARRDHFAGMALWALGREAANGR